MAPSRGPPQASGFAGGHDCRPAIIKNNRMWDNPVDVYLDRVISDPDNPPVLLIGDYKKITINNGEDDGNRYVRDPMYLSYNDTPSYGAWLKIRSNDTELTGLSGPTVEWSDAIPAGSMVLGVSAHIKSGGIGGCNTIDIGDGVTADAFIKGLPAGGANSATLDKWGTSQPCPIYTSTADIVLSAIGGGESFTGGDIRLTLFYIQITAPSNRD